MFYDEDDDSVEQFLFAGLQNQMGQSRKLRQNRPRSWLEALAAAQPPPLVAPPVAPPPPLPPPPPTGQEGASAGEGGAGTVQVFRLEELRQCWEELSWGMPAEATAPGETASPEDAPQHLHPPEESKPSLEAAPPIQADPHGWSKPAPPTGLPTPETETAPNPDKRGGAMATISLCMIVRDEEDVLARCLDSIKDLVDEIIIVDTGSVDSTKEIALAYTDKVYDFAWCDDFAAARNESFSKATMDYCLWLDADDILLEKDRQGFRELKRLLDGRTDIVMMRYNVGFDQSGQPNFSYYRERLIRREAGHLWKGAVHEVISPAGTIVHSEVAVTHRKLRPSDPMRNVRIFEKLIEKGETLDPRQQFYYGRELYYHQRHQEAVTVLQGFLDEGKGWVENNIEACRQLCLCHTALGNRGEAMAALFRSFVYDAPRAEICCDLGQRFLEEGRLQQAIFWYELALTRTANTQGGGFTLLDCYGYLPCIQLCVCYDKLGDYARASEYNERACAYKPESPACAYNRKYFEGLLAPGNPQPQ